MLSPVYERTFNEFGAFKPSSGYEVLKNAVSGWKLSSNFGFFICVMSLNILK